ncbi:MAG TPA: phosphotransferase, partial [Candidatus Limnocylindria bacterium]|nr:phosphotransferase [Candidatus Limnocylindria bacterium]
SGRSDVVSLSTDRGTIIIKRYRASVDDPAIAGEHSVLLELGRRCFPAPRLVGGPSGETLVRHAGERYAAFEALEGYQPAHALLSLPGAARRLARDAGRSLAALHSALDRFAPSGTNPDGLSWPDGGRVRPVDWYLERLSAATGGRGLDPDEQRRAGERLAALETELPARLPRRAVIHGDYGPYNLLVRPGEPLVVTDFELARLDWSLTDLATALPRFAANRFGLSHRRALAFLDGYTAVIPLSEEERRLIPQVLEYLSLRRVAVCVGRWMSTGEQRWLDEAVAKVRQARMLRDGRHPLARLLD